MSDSVKVIVDEDVCTGNGTCARIAPTVFELSAATGIATVLLPELTDEGLIALAEEAEQACPTLAIRIER